MSDTPDASSSTTAPISTLTPVNASLRRIKTAGATADQQLQAATETVVVLHSIRRILLWTLVIVPLVLGAVGLVLVLDGQSATKSTCTSIYSTRC